MIKMSKLNIKQSAQTLAASTVVLSSVFVLTFSGTAAARDGSSTDSGSHETTTETHNSATGTETEHSTTATKTEDHSSKLAADKLKFCQQREKTIDNILNRAAKRGDNQIKVFNSIAEKTEAFYAKSGKSLSNYDQLVSDVNAKKAAAQAAVSAVDSSSANFKCDGTDPKGAASAFKDKVKAEIAALKAYKTAVKNLIVGVKSVQGDASSEGSQQ
jgi:hypothetical protein